MTLGLLIGKLRGDDDVVLYEANISFEDGQVVLCGRCATGSALPMHNGRIHACHVGHNLKKIEVSNDPHVSIEQMRFTCSSTNMTVMVENRSVNGTQIMHNDSRVCLKEKTDVEKNSCYVLPDHTMIKVIKIDWR